MPVSRPSHPWRRRKRNGNKIRIHGCNRRHPIPPPVAVREMRPAAGVYREGRAGRGVPADNVRRRRGDEYGGARVVYALQLPVRAWAGVARRRRGASRILGKFGGEAERRMIFETLYESARRGELLLIDGGFCHWHLRRDGQLTIREIISTRPGAGSEMLEVLRKTPGALFLFAKCPADLPSNTWYRRHGFICDGEETTKTGRKLMLWRLQL